MLLPDGLPPVVKALVVLATLWAPLLTPVPLAGVEWAAVEGGGKRLFDELAQGSAVRSFPNESWRLFCAFTGAGLAA